MTESGAKVHEHGYVELLDHMGSDQDIVDAARISYDRRGITEDRNLIRYLLRNGHTSPFEMAVMKFEIKMPIFVARQWVRHRTASMNEVSARYTQLPNEMFVPDVFATQSAGNKQGREEMLDTESVMEGRDWPVGVKAHHDEAYSLYERMLDSGVSREIARGVLPFNIYTKFVWKMDLHNLMHFLHLRLDPHAQQEIRDYAQVIEVMVTDLFPLCHEAFVDYVRDAYTCSRMEVEVLRGIIKFATRLVDERYGAGYDPTALCDTGHGMSKRELADFKRRFLDG